MKIVSLLPSTTEICYVLGLGDQLAGVTHECDYPPEARGKPHLTRNVLPPGEHSSADIDRMISERILNGQSIYHLDRGLLAEIAPDLILTQELCDVCAVSYDEVLDAARSLPKIPHVAAFEPHNIDEILASIEEVARLASVPERGREAVAGYRARMAEVERRLDGVEPKRVLCLEWLDPPMVGGHWVPQMVRLAGGVDVLGPEGQPSVYVDWDAVVASDPQVVILMPCGYDLAASIEAARELDNVAAWRNLPAVQSGQVFAVDGSGYFNRPGPRVIGGVELLARLLHPRECHGLGPCNAARRLQPGSNP